MWNSMATLEALIMAFLALPVWTDSPWMVTVDRGGVEVFVLDAAHVAAVHGVGEVSAEPVQVEQGRHPRRSPRQG